MPRVGVMQGRLSPRPKDRLQVFPKDWARELETAARQGYEFLEWLLLAAAAGENPLDSSTGRREMRRVASSAGLPIASVCAARFVSEPLAGLPATIIAAAEVGARHVVVPLLEQAHVRTAEREDRAVAELAGCLDRAERAGLTLVLELDVSGATSARILGRLDHPSLRVCYDVGNATALGLDAAVDVGPVLDRLGEVHVKDRLVAGGPSVTLGTGDAHFRGFFRTLRSAGYAGDIVLEHFFDEQPEAEARRALEFVRTQLRDAGY